jgi:glyoxylase-like metal-dependent hydrolase (beta-lactamase superfamily II)
MLNTLEIIPGLTKISLTIPRSGFESFINAWLVQDKEKQRTLLFECGPASAADSLKADLKQLGVTNVDYLVLTHVHLDHSGGAGQFTQSFPGVKIITNPKGKKHLMSPQQLVEESRISMGDLCDDYGVPEPVPETALADDGFSPDGLEIIETPGHASHHNSYVYDLGGTKILFAGEAAGCCFELPNACMFMRPATPHKFYYDDAVASIDKLLSLHGISFVCYPHAGSSHNWKELVKDARTQMGLWKDVIGKLPDGISVSDAVTAVKKADPVMDILQYLPDKDRKREEFFIKQSVKGFMGYFARKKKENQGE